MSRTTGHLRFAVTGSAVVAVVAACGAFSGSGGSTSVDTDAGDDGMSAADTSVAVMSDGSQCAVIYVDGNGTAGADTNDGCGTNRPMHSIGSAIMRAKAAGASEIHVCAGTFDEAPITLDAPVSLLGSYLCGSFSQPAEGDGGIGVTFMPTTTLSAPTAVPATVIVTGAAVTATTRLDGFSVQGGTSTSAPSVALHVTAGASPTLSNLVVAGGNGRSSTGTGSIGVSIDGAAAPVLTQVTVSGGTGVSNAAGGSSVGSIGVYAADAGLFEITGSTIDGGKGTSSANGSVGVSLYRSSPTSAPAGDIFIENSSISGGQGNGTTLASIAIATYADPRLKIVRNQITGGSGQCPSSVNPASPCAVGAIYAGNTSAIEVSRNAIYAASGASPLVSTSAYGIWFINPPNPSALLVHQNMIVAAGADTAIGARFVAADGVQIVGNTIVGAPTASTYGVELVGTINAVLENNLISVSHAIRLIGTTSVPACTTGLVIANDALLTASGARTLELAACGELDGGSPLNATTLDALTAAVPTAHSNVRLAMDCTGDASCTRLIGCATDPLCYAAVFAGPLPDAPTLFSQGIPLAPTAPCAVMQGGLVLTSEPVDYYGKARGPSFSIGADQEPAGSCTN